MCCYEERKMRRRKVVKRRKKVVFRNVQDNKSGSDDDDDEEEERRENFLVNRRGGVGGDGGLGNIDDFNINFGQDLEDEQMLDRRPENQPYNDPEFQACFTENRDEDEDEELLSLPDELSEDEDDFENDSCVCCEGELLYGDSVPMAERIHERCNHIMFNGIKNNKLDTAAKDTETFMQKYVVEPHNEYVENNPDKNMNRIREWKQGDIKRHFTKCIDNIDYRCRESLKIHYRIIHSLIKYDLMFTRNDGPFDERIKKRRRVKHTNPLIAKLVCSLIKENVLLDLKLKKEFDKRNSKRNKSSSSSRCHNLVWGS